jgi:hypothetical protein
MVTDSPVTRAVRALRLLRDHTPYGGGLPGGEYDRLIRSAMPRRTSNLNWPTDLIRTLIRANLVEVRFADHEEPLTADQFERSLLEYGLNSYVFSLVSHFDHLCSVLGIVNLSELEQRANPRSVSITPIFGPARQTGMLRRDITVLIPAGVTGSPVYTEAIRPVCEELELTSTRAENLFARQDVMPDLWSSIYIADLIIADCTGNEAAVFYGLGMAHTIGKTTLLLAQNLEDIPYNALQHHYIIYHPSQPGFARLRQDLRGIIPQLRHESVAG